MSYRPHFARLLIAPVAVGAVFGTASSAEASELVVNQTTTDRASYLSSSDVLDDLVVKYAPSLLQEMEAAKAAPAAPVVPVAEVPKAEIQAAATAAVLKACASSNAIGEVVYKVDGKVVDGLQGNTTQGSVVRVEFKIAAECEDTQVGLAAYEAPAGTWDPATAHQQKLISHQSGTFKADGTVHALEVELNDCYYQVDFFTGPVLTSLSATKNYSNPEMNLIEFDNGGTKTCDVPPPPPPPPVDKCPAEVDAQLLDYTFTINGVAGFADLSSAEAGDTVRVDFTIAEDCEDVQLSLVSYDAIGPDFTRESALSQVLFDSETGKFDAGKHSMEIQVPDCFFQVDFVRGDVIQQFGPVDSNNYYADQDRLIDADTGGTACEVPEAPDQPVEVLGVSYTAPQAQLAETGVESTDLALLGAALMLMGGALNRAAARARRSTEGAAVAL